MDESGHRSSSYNISGPHQLLHTPSGRKMAQVTSLINGPTESLWHDALRTLSPEEQQSIGILAANSKLSNLDKVLASVEEKKELCMQKRWKYEKKSGTVIILRDVFERIARYIHKFKEAVDVAIQVDPLHAALPWAGIRILLQISINDIEMFGVMMEGVETVTSIISRYAVFEQFYLDGASKVKDQLLPRLVELYAAVLIYLSKAYHFYNSNTLKRVALSAVNSTQNSIDAYLHKITVAESVVLKVASLVDTEYSRDMRVRVAATETTVDRVKICTEQIHSDTSTQHSVLQSSVGEVDSLLRALQGNVEAYQESMTLRLASLENNQEGARREISKALRLAESFTLREEHQSKSILRGDVKQAEKTFITLPVSKNPLFTGREEMITRIHDSLGHGEPHRIHVDSTVVLFGLGGIGKTQLAVQYAYSFANCYSCIWWIDMTNRHRFISSIFNNLNAFIDDWVQKLSAQGALIKLPDIAVNLGLPPNSLGNVGQLSMGQSCDSQMVLRVFKRLLASYRSKRWLAILDNYDDPESVDITDALPRNGIGSVIITTRLTDQQIHGVSIEIDEIDEESGLELLVKTARRDYSSFSDTDLREAKAIVQRLGGLPLAIVQAGAFLLALQLPFSGYLSRFDNQAQKLMSKTTPKTLWKQRDDTVFSTWEVSIESLDSICRDAVLTLDICAFLDNGNIQEEMFINGVEFLKQEFDFGDCDEALSNLFRFSLAKRKDRTDSFWIHPLVHAWARERLQEQKARQMSEVAAHLVTTTLYWDADAERTSSHEIHQTDYLSHVSIGCLYADKMLSQGAWSSKGIAAAYTLARIAYGFHQIDKTLRLMDLFIQRQPNDGSFSVRVCRAFVYQARARRDQDKYVAAQELCGRALASAQQSLGCEHSETMMIMRDMALIIYFQGRLGESLHWYERTLTEQERILGEDHSETLHTVGQTAMVLARQNRMSEAVSYFQRALSGQEQALGRNHTRTLLCAHGLAQTYANGGEFAAALPHFERAFVDRKKVLGADHPDTLYSLNGVANCYAAQSRYKEAVAIFEEVLELREKVHGKGGLQTLYTVHDMAEVYAKQGEWEQALQLHERALTSRSKLLGLTHYHTLASMHANATLLATLGRVSEAIQLLARALPGSISTSGENHLATLALMHDLGILYCENGNGGEGRQLLEKALLGREGALGVDAELTVESREALKKFDLQVLESLKTPIAAVPDAVASLVSAGSC